MDENSCLAQVSILQRKGFKWESMNLLWGEERLAKCLDACETAMLVVPYS